MVLVLEHHITALATMGPDGYDGHPDHIATHQAALQAQRLLHEQNYSVYVLALRRDGAGEVVFAVDRERKMAALAHHATQMPLDAHGQLDVQRFLQEHAAYSPLLERETYDIYAP